MGKFIDEPEKELINNYFDSYMDATNRYAKQQSAAHVYVDYYSLDLNASTKDLGLNNVTEVVGGESPVRYKKIEDLPIFLDNEVSFMQQLEEDSGFDAESEGSATITPGTIIPQNDDLLVFKFLERKYVYRVSNVETSNTSMRTFYKITFFVSPFDIDSLEEHQVTDNYKTIYHNIGTELDPIIPEKNFTLIDDIEGILKYLTERYVRFYYDSKINAFIYNKDKMNLAIHQYYKDNGIYDPKLALFIQRNKLFINKKTFLKNIYVECLLSNRDLDYEKSLYSYLETGDTEEYEYPFFYFNKIFESTFMLFRDKFHELVHSPVSVYDNGKKLEVDLNKVKDGKFTKIDLKKYVEDDSYLIDDIDDKEKIIVIYLRILKLTKHDNISDHYEDIVEISKNLKIEKDFDTYLLIPCVIFILKKIQEKLMHKTNYIN